jgi:cardiolipin synthase A/B
MHPAILVLLTVVGTVLILLFVLNFSAAEKKIQYRVPTLYGVEDPQFERTMSQLLGPPLVVGNQVTSLLNGDQIFPAMLQAIQSAQKSISFETYIYWSGKIGREFADALSERARAGIKVHVLLDWVGAGKMDKNALQGMREAGVQIEKFRPPRWYSVTRMNHRTHRKLLVIDGNVGFTGGVGIADQWLGNAESPEHWRDSHFRLVGPAVAHMQAAFMDNWIKARAEVLHGNDYFPAIAEAGPCHAQAFNSSAEEGSESARLMYLLSIASARRSIRVANSYFVPDDLSVQSFVDARKRDVQVEIIVPGPLIDTSVVRRASRARWGPLLEAGVEIFEYQPTMYHCKVMVVDDLWVSVGSTNFDSRSFRLNDEANLNIYDAEVAREQNRVFEQDKSKSNRVTLEKWKKRPISEKITEHLAALLRSQL